MENLPPYSLHLQSLLASSSAQNEVPRSDAIQALRGHVEALLVSAQRRLVVLRIGKERVEALRVRDAAREKMVATEREREKERERERDRERKEKERKEKERQRREKERDDRERDRQEIQQEARQAQTASKGAAATKGAAQPSNKAINRPPTVKVELDAADTTIPVASTSKLPRPTPAGSDGDESDDSQVALTHRKKKKRKHGLITSDNEDDRSGRAGADDSGRRLSRSPSRAAHPPPTGLTRPKIKLFTSRRSTSPNHTNPLSAAPTNIDFSLSTGPRSLVPERPPVPAPPVPGPMNQSEVNEDFSNAKAPPTQVLFSTFWQGIEPYVRQLGEEDLAFLKGYKDEDIEPYGLPPLGKPYQQIWDEEDRLIAAGLPVPIVSSTSPLRAAQHPNRTLDYSRMNKREYEYDSREMTEEDLVVEDKGAGPLTERVVSALLAAREEADAPIGFGNGNGNGNVNVVASGSGNRSAPSGDAGAAGASAGGVGPVEDEGWGGEHDSGPERISMGDMEARMRKELQAVGLLGGDDVDWSERADDEISTSLRQAQRLLATQTSLNDARRATLLSIAQDRLAFAEYQQCLDGLDRIIDSGWSKRQRLLQRQQKRKEKSASVLGPREREKEEKERETNRKLGEHLKLAIAKRKKFVEHVGGMFKREEDTLPGRFWGLPKASVFAGIGEPKREPSESDSGQAVVNAGEAGNDGPGVKVEEMGLIADTPSMGSLTTEEAKPPAAGPKAMAVD